MSRRSNNPTSLNCSRAGNVTLISCSLMFLASACGGWEVTPLGRRALGSVQEWNKVRTTMVDSIGWLATAIFVSSYFCKRPATLRRVQAAGALMWLTYGVLIHALLVVVRAVGDAGAESGLWGLTGTSP